MGGGLDEVNRATRLCEVPSVCAGTEYGLVLPTSMLSSSQWSNWYPIATEVIVTVTTVPGNVGYCPSGGSNVPAPAGDTAIVTVGVGGVVEYSA